MSTEPLTRRELDRMTCASPGCDHTTHTADGLVMNSLCHMRHGIIVNYWAGGVVEARCKICNKWVCSIAVSPEDQVALDKKTTCDDPECKEPAENHRLAIKSPCHPKGGLDVVYVGGRLEMACARCKQEITHVHVKEATASA